jgi:RNA polymerase sigma-70 factor (ECF subfamily)
MSVRGVLDAATAPLLHASTRPEAVATASRSSDGEAFHLDLAGLTHLDGAGLRALDVLATTIGDRGSTLHVTTPFSAELARLLDFAVSMQWLPANFAGKPSGPTRPHCDRAGARQTEQTPTPTHSARLAELEALYDRHASACWSLARHLLADDDKADAVVQNAFLQSWQQLTSDTRPAGQTGAQLLGRTHGEAVHRLREERTGPWPPTRPPDGEPPGALNQRHDRRPPQSHPRAGLSGLPEQQASALRLAFWTGLTVQEIAATTGTPLADVRANLLAGVRTLTRERNHPPPSGNGRGHGAALQ